MDRRQALVMAVAAAGCASTPTLTTPARTGGTFVLVHGAWHGGWCWRDVRSRLEAEGARVFTPTLTGLGERAHLRTPMPTLAMHVADVCAVLESEELTDVVLVGHSYAGMVVTGVADRMKARLRRVIYLDAALPADGQSMITQRPGLSAAGAQESAAQLRGLAADGWMPPFPPAVFGIDPANADATAWLARRLTPHPLQTWLDPIALPNGGSAGLPRTYILCTTPPLQGTGFAERAAALKGQPGWRVREIATGHDAMVSAPDETARLLLEQG